MDRGFYYRFVNPPPEAHRDFISDFVGPFNTLEECQNAATVRLASTHIAYAFKIEIVIITPVSTVRYSDDFDFKIEIVPNET